MIAEDLETTMKVIVVGNGQVGKSSLITSFARDQFLSTYKKTLGVDFLERRLFIDDLGQEVIFFLWDTAGQEEYDAITRGYYKGASAAIIAFSTTDRASFEAVEKWHRKLREECGGIPAVLVQNKVDLIDEAVVSQAEAEALATKLRLRLYRCCVKERLAVGEIFVHLAKEFLRQRSVGSCTDQLQTISIQADQVAKIQLNLKKNDKKKSTC